MVNMRFSVFTCLVLTIMIVQSVSGAITKVRSLQKQCVDQGFGGVCTTSTKNPTAKTRCSQELQCAVIVGRDTFKQAGGRVPDGTTCGDKKVCINKKCTAVEEMPTIVGSESAVTCKKVVPVANKIERRPLEPLSP